MYSSASSYILFFFQAEDGIRDGHVTGVQTCALPIFEEVLARASAGERLKDAAKQVAQHAPGVTSRELYDLALQQRSEERRVGKELTAGRVPELNKAEKRDMDDAPATRS